MSCKGLKNPWQPSARLQKSIEMLRLQATPTEADSAIQTLFRIIKNVIEHPNDIKYKRLRKVWLAVFNFVILAYYDVAFIC